MDLNPENVEAVKNGELLFDIGGHWLQGGFALVMLYDHLKGKLVPTDQDNVKLKLLPLTKDAVAQFEKDFPAECRLMTSRRTRESTPRMPRRPSSSCQVLQVAARRSRPARRFGAVSRARPASRNLRDSSSLRDLSKRFGSTRAFDDVSMPLRPGGPRLRRRERRRQVHASEDPGRRRAADGGT